LSNELAKRVATGVVGAAVLLFLLLQAGAFGAFLVTLVLSMAMAREFCNLTLGLPDKLEKTYLLLVLAWVVVTLNFLFQGAELGLLLFSFLVLFTYFLLRAPRHAGPELQDHFKELMALLFGTLYLIILPLLLLRIHSATNGSRWVVAFLLMNWAGDTGAYFGGRRFGRRKLYPLISPKKTREGALAGLVGGLVATLIFKLAAFRAMPWGAVLVVPLLVGAFSQVGDLCESFLKRAYDKKDSGSFLPGHGGFLDRFDGVVFSLPVMYACVKIFG
jgi:phosphatidate cytidylyltransferase